MELECMLNCFSCIFISFLLLITYVSSLYIWKSPFNRDHPDVIKKRFVSVIFMIFLSPCFLYIGMSKDVLLKTSLFHLLGFKSEGLIQSIFIPLFLTMILFLGPLSLQIYDGRYKLNTELQDWFSRFKDLLWIRNFLVAPFSEEFTFRSCMVPILLQCFSPMTVVFVAPLFFGTGHLHHLWDRIKTGFNIKTALAVSFFQFTFTTIFGMYSTFIFIRTGHFIPTFIIHAFCNHMGFPSPEDVMDLKGMTRVFILLLFILGVVLWYYLLFSLTNPSLYYNDKPWHTLIS